MKRYIKISVSVIIFLLTLNTFTAAEEVTLATMNVWPAVETSGFFSCDELEPENDRQFRHEILISGLKDLDADVMVLNGLNPAETQAGEIAEALGMNYLARTAGSGLRIGPVSLPVNLKIGDAVLYSENVVIEPSGYLHMNGFAGGEIFTLFSKSGVQIIGCRVSKGDVSFYLFSAVWSESLFDDKDSLMKLLDSYKNGELSPSDYTALVENAVEGAEIRKRQAVETLSFVNSIAGEAPVVLMGSLNALPGSGEIATLIDAGFIDAFKRAGRGAGFTIDAGHNTNYSRFQEGSPQAALALMSGRYRGDYIMYRGSGLKPLSIEVVLDKPVYGVFPSSRYGLKAVIEFEPNPSSR